MWYAIKPFRYRGKKYAAGDEVPASSWPARKALVVRHKIKFIAPNPALVSPADIKKMTRAELNVHAKKLGIENPESFPNRDSLIQAMSGEAVDEEQEDDSETDDSNETSESSDPDDEDPEDEGEEEFGDDEDEEDDE